MSRKNRTPDENAHREKIRELLQMENIGSMDDLLLLRRGTGHLPLQTRLVHRSWSVGSPRVENWPQPVRQAERYRPKSGLVR